VPKFSVVVPCLNEEKYIGVLLQSLVEQTDKDFDVTVVDGKSEDGTLEVIDSFKGKLPLKVLTSEKRHPTYQRNMGAFDSKGEFILFFDADVKLEPSFISSIRRNLERDDIDVFTSWNKPLSDRPGDHLAYYIFNIVYLETHKYFKPGAVGTFIGFRRSAFEKLDGFDEDVILAEDFELVRRSHKEGFRYKLFRDPPIWTSVRRYDRDGRLKVLLRLMYAGMYMNFRGPIKKKVVDWELGDHD
jgi:glycosyltransferase involved in cell wall biosynthesis